MTDSFKEDSNRAFETAKLTSYWLYLAGIPEALEFGKQIGLDKMDASAIPYSEEMCFLNPIIQEIRYKSINRYIRASGCKSVLDIACGYSPRGMQLAREGYHYYGADFPVVTEELAPVARKLGLENCEYHAADATNYASLAAITDRIDGAICIVVEGLGMYLTAAEARTVRENIARIMREHEGSVYVTTDPGNGYLFANVIRSVYPFGKFMPTIGKIFRMYNWASNGGITRETVKRPLRIDVKLYRRAGLEAKRCRLLPGDTELLMFSGLPDPIVRKLRRAMEKRFVFVSTILPQKNHLLQKEQEKPEESDPEDSFSLESSLEGDTLKISLSGRVDTLSAPKILECFDEYKAQAHRVEVDMKRVTYLSSAGTRVLYLIRKNLEKEELLTVLEVPSCAVKNELDDEIIERL